MTIDEAAKYLKGVMATAQLYSDPRSRKCVEAIEKTLRTLDERMALQNRCFTLTEGGMCAFCDMECHHKR